MNFQNNNQAIYYYQLFLRMQQNPLVPFIDGYVNPYFIALNNVNIRNNPINNNINNINNINNNNLNNNNIFNRNNNLHNRNNNMHNRNNNMLNINNNMHNRNNNNINNNNINNKNINNNNINNKNINNNNINNNNINNNNINNKNNSINSINTSIYNGLNNSNQKVIGGNNNNGNNSNGLNLSSNTIENLNQSFMNISNHIRINPNNNEVNLEEEITIIINLKDDNNSNSSPYTIKAKLKENFKDVLNKLKTKQTNFERNNYSQLIFNENKDLISEDKNLYENNIKDGEIINLMKISENNNNNNIDKLEKEEKEIIEKWFNEYKANKALEYFAIILSLPDGQTPPNFKSMLKPEEFQDFIIEKDQNLGLEVKEHEHKLIYCLTSFNWICNKCNNNYDSSKPTYFCSLCDYNMCDNCRKEGKYEEKLSFPKIIIPPNESIKLKFKTINDHEHKLAYCRHINRIIGPTYWECNRCHIHNEREIWSFYCTVCNLDFCIECIPE